MKISSALLALAALTSCADSLENISDDVYASRYRHGVTDFESNTRPAEVAYYLQKYGAVPAQYAQAAEAGRRFVGTRSSIAASRHAKPSPKYIAVQVQKVSHSRGPAQVMLFDTKTQQVVGNDVYDLKSTPKKFEPLMFDTYSAEYVGIVQL